MYVVYVSEYWIKSSNRYEDFEDYVNGKLSTCAWHPIYRQQKGEFVSNMGPSGSDKCLYEHT